MIANFILFQTLWFSAVIGAGRFDLTWVAIVGSLPLLIWTTLRTPHTRTLSLLLIWGAAGCAMDAAWMAAGALNYPGHELLPPYWIVLLWCGVGLTVDHSLKWFRDHPAIGSVAAGIFGPLSYVGGERMGAQIVLGDLALLPVLGLTWIVLFYGLFTLARGTQGDESTDGALLD